MDVNTDRKQGLLHSLCSPHLKHLETIVTSTFL